ncbi:hypothetical protein SASPL_109883 [Salvia splendens]|uniref:Molybdenum cofactor sulfurase n=1 Tax=Salvia splendens TaxID=180675 RepID=A0A8X8YFP3_SALSN|nr:hypothetical protein SASPL_109883 [Salvia splendens]
MLQHLLLPSPPPHFPSAPPPISSPPSPPPAHGVHQPRVAPSSGGSSSPPPSPATRTTPPPKNTATSAASPSTTSVTAYSRTPRPTRTIASSTSRTAGAETELHAAAKRRVMKYMNLSEEDYAIVFTANQSSAFSLLAQSYPFEPRQNLVMVYDHDSEALKPMTDAAGKCGGLISWPGFRVISRKLRKILTSKNRGLLAFPLQSKVSGARYSASILKLPSTNMGIVNLVPEPKAVDETNSTINDEVIGFGGVDELGLIGISGRARCLMNWVVNALQSLRHPGEGGWRWWRCTGRGRRWRLMCVIGRGRGWRRDWCFWLVGATSLSALDS